MFLSSTQLAALAILAAPLVHAENCDNFLSKQICSTRAANLVGEVQDVVDPASCQALCSASQDCQFFTWIRYVASLHFPTSCILFRACDTPEACGDECEYSLLGPKEPAYPAVCCAEFRPDPVCDGTIENILQAVADVTDVYTCQELCQEVDSCRYFLFDEPHTRCFLLMDCNSKTSCEGCWSGPQYPSLDSCAPPTNDTSTTQPWSTTTTASNLTTTTPPPSQSTAALLLGGFKAGTMVESWPCDLAVPDLPEEVFIPAAALLGSKVFLCGGYNGATVYYSACSILESGSWSAGPAMLEKRRMFTLNRVGDMLVAAGGHNGQELSSVEIFREGGTKWEQAPWKLAAARREHCAATLSDSELIVAGGRGVSGTFNTVEKYNVQTGVMEPLPALTKAREDLACTLLEGSLVVSGGYSGGYLDLVEKLDLSTGTWSSLPSLKVARVYHTMGVFNGSPAVFGGETTGAIALDTLEVLNGSTWQTSFIKGPRNAHAMVQLPCP